MIALINSPNTGWQRLRSAIGDEWHFSELNGEVESFVEKPHMCILECIKI